MAIMQFNCILVEISMYLSRTLEPIIQKASRQFPVVMVTGARQVGKTTFLRHLAGKKRNYVTLDDPTLLALAKEEPKLFLERFKPPVLIDEIQYAPELLPHIKINVDNNRIAGQYWLTGSQPFHLMRGVSESLAGRVGILNLLGLSQWEIQKLPNFDLPFLPGDKSIGKKLTKMEPASLEAVYKRIWYGSFPAIALNVNADKDLFFSSYVQTYLQRDVRDLAQVGNESSFLRFLKVTAARTGQLLNLADIARDTDISPNTAKHWLSILQTSGIIYLLEPYHNNLNKRLIKTPKLYYIDTGLCSYLTRWSDYKTLEAGAMSGAILETFVVMEILKSYWHNGLQAPLYFYRDKDKKEIDLLIVKNQKIYPIEIKKTASPKREILKDFKVLDSFKENVSHGAVVCLVDTLIPLDRYVDAVPITLI
ncbi:ATP-binding protein [Coxiella burnetii]|uniref:Hypothetical ATPase n=2 Tax=Coxiella burnetii TaxID=777 RepID=Q83DG6_COXBU|nr:ATP-binding protein [Coxiella burnetii]NP_819792.2 hypothetical ATPase [Coxiella burnetii RSA 493]AAO90306.2 hypothetical ATPase [Coxiella burnetii RSA 493]ABS76805.2 hypothetical ATPase [Coxiella burnetii Dugway 5J108-111]ARI65607.1 ATPase [Coxiella burnetii]MCF2093682.1 ATP-binding protein [Coxiella burnetii]MCF2094798.1 ATP-binding protein [Coxiella burnetii]